MILLPGQDGFTPVLFGIPVLAPPDAVQRADCTDGGPASDRGIRARIQQFFEAEWADPNLYDLSLNTEQSTIDAAADLLCHLLTRPERQATAASRAVLQDGALATRVRAALKAAPEPSRLNVDIRCRGGQVELAGTVGSEAARDAATRVAAAQAEVQAVKNWLLLMKISIR